MSKKMVYPDFSQTYADMESAAADWAKRQNNDARITAEPAVTDRGKVKWEVSFDLSDPIYDGCAYIDGLIDGWLVLFLNDMFPGRVDVSRWPIIDLEMKISKMESEAESMSASIKRANE